jgi:hypothetical protein
MQRLHASFASVLGGTMLGLATLVLAGSGCNCDPASTDVDPECPGGISPSSTITIRASLDGIRPVGADKQIRVRGTRNSAASLCFTPGDRTSFSDIVMGTGNQVVVVTPLAFGPWELQVTPLSGGDHPVLPPLLRTLAAGVDHTLLIQPTVEGDITLQFTP